MSETTFMKISQILAMIPVNRTTIDNWIEKGEFPSAVKIGGIRLWDRDEVYRAIGHTPPKPARVHDDLI